MKNLKITNLFVYLFIAMFAIVSVSAAGGLSVVLNNQNPDPVSPGNFVFVNVKVSNAGSDNVKFASIEFLENENFKLAQGETFKQEIGSVPAFSSTSSSSYYIAKYKLLVDDGTPFGMNTLKFILNADGGLSEYEFDILVQDANPTITVSSIEVDEIEAGDSGKFVLILENSNSAKLSDVTLRLNLDEVEEQILSTKSGSNLFVVGSLSADEDNIVEFDLVVSPDASAEPVLLPMTIEYEDSLGNSYVQDLSASIRVYSNPEITFKLDSQEVYSVGSGKITFAIANPGTSTVKGVSVEILNGDSYEVIDGDFEYVGNLNPDDFQTLQSEIYIKNSDVATLKIKLSYSDSYNVKKEEIIDVPLKIYSSEDLTMFGLAGAKSSSGGYTSIIVWLVIVIIGFYLGRRNGIKKSKHSIKK